MAKGRFVSRSISTNEQLAGVSFAADYFFTRCLAHLDVEGRLTGNAVLLKSSIVPLRDEITARSIPKLLEELGAAVDHNGRSLLVWYEVGAQRVLFFPGFAEQQSGLRPKRESPSKLPPLSDKATVLAGQLAVIGPSSLRQNDGGMTELSRSNDGPTPPQGEVEVQVEVEVQELPSSSRARGGFADAGLAERLPTALDRDALATLLSRVPQPVAWAAEIRASLDGMPGHVLLGADRLGEALRDFVANGALERPNLRQFRRYLGQAATALQPAAVGANGNGGETEYERDLRESREWAARKQRELDANG